MKLTVLAALTLGAVSSAAAPATSSLPLCHVVAVSSPAPGLDVPFVGLPFRNITITADTGCLPARIALSNYGGRAQGQPLTLQPGQRLTLGPVPLYRRLSWLAASGFPYDVPIHPARGAP